MEQFRTLEKEVTDIAIHCILVNDGSRIKLKPAEIEFLNEHISHFEYIELDKNLGKGMAVRTGLARCQHDFFMFTDVDFPYFAHFAASMIHSVMKNEFDVMIGHRPEAYYQQIPLLRRMLSKSLRNLIKLVMHIPVSDTQSGLKVFNQSGRESLLSTTIYGYLFDLEFIRLAAKKNLRIGSIELVMRPEIEQPQMSLSSLLKESKNFIKILLNR